MSKFLKGIGLVVILVALLLSVAFLPSIASASHGGWGIATNTDLNTDPNPNAHFINLQNDTGMSPTMLFGWDAWLDCYNMCLAYPRPDLYTLGPYIPYGSFSCANGMGFWIKFAYPNVTEVTHWYSHISASYVQCPVTLKGPRWDPINCRMTTGWNMVGSPYGLTGYLDAQGHETYIDGTPLSNFEFRIPNSSTWFNFHQAKNAEWISSAWWWNCMYESPPGTESPRYLYLGAFGADDIVPRAHGFWIHTTTTLEMRITRPPGINPTPTGLTATGPLGSTGSGTDGMPGAPPAPY